MKGRRGRCLIWVLFVVAGVVSTWGFLKLARTSILSYSLEQTSSPTQYTDTGAPKANDQKQPADATLHWFLPNTEAERELEQVLRGGDEHIDLALASWLVVADLPEFRDMTREGFFGDLSAMAEQVRQEMARRSKVAEAKGKDANDPATRCGIFCGSIIKLGFAYAEEKQMRQLYSEANNVFLAGLLRTRRGSCVSMPLVYLVIGQRLGTPVHLVAVGKHYFLRWEEKGYRMNIEPTIVDRVAVHPDDSVYLEIEGMTAQQVKGSELRNLTNREVVGQLYFARSGYWGVKGANHAAARGLDLSRARHLAPDDPAIKASQEAMTAQYIPRKPISAK